MVVVYIVPIWYYTPKIMGHLVLTHKYFGRDERNNTIAQSKSSQVGSEFLQGLDQKESNQKSSQI